MSMIVLLYQFDQYEHSLITGVGKVAGATCGAGDAHFSGTPDLTLSLGSTLPVVQYTEFARIWNTNIGND